MQEAVIKTIPKKKKCRKTKWLSEEAVLRKEEKLNKGPKTMALSKPWFFQ